MNDKELDTLRRDILDIIDKHCFVNYYGNVDGIFDAVEEILMRYNVIDKGSK